MAFFQSIINSIWNGVAWVFGAAKKTTSLSPRGYLIVHLIVLLVIALVAGIFNQKILDFFGLERADSGSDTINEYLCGWLVLTLYAFVRLILFVIRLFGMEDTPEFPDIDRAWTEAMTQLGVW